MKPIHLVDTGPLVAFLNRRERHHGWTVDWFDTLESPLLTCESLISEACFLLRRAPAGVHGLLELIQRSIVVIDFMLSAQIGPVANLMKTYASVPMSLADACLVRMSELHPNSKLITLDSDFKLYRRKSRQIIPAN